MLNQNSKIYVSGHTGLLGSGIVRKLTSLGYHDLILRTHSELDLTIQKDTFEFFDTVRPTHVFLSAALVGGIKANLEALGEFLYQNMLMQMNAIEGARLSGVKKLIFVASTCVYPRDIKNPISEDQLMTGSFEPTNEGYAVAKFAGLKMCEMYRKQYGVDFVSVIPCNLIGINDHYDHDNSHVLQSLIVKIHNAKINNEKRIVLWGSGKPRREFMSSDDCADAIVNIMEFYSDDSPINIGTGTDLSIIELAEAVSEVLKWNVIFDFDTSMPDGIFQKLSDTTKINNLGWHPKISIKEAIKFAYDDFLSKI